MKTFSQSLKGFHKNRVTKVSHKIIFKYVCANISLFRPKWMFTIRVGTWT